MHLCDELKGSEINTNISWVYENQLTLFLFMHVYAWL